MTDTTNTPSGKQAAEAWSFVEAWPDIQAELARHDRRDGYTAVDVEHAEKDAALIAWNLARLTLPAKTSGTGEAAIRGRFRLIPIAPRPECCSPNTGDCCGTEGSGCGFEREVERAEKEFDAALATLPPPQAEPCTLCNALIVARNPTHYDQADLDAARVRGTILAERIAERSAPQTEQRCPECGAKGDCYCNGAAQAGSACRAPDGWVLVPVEPTRAMLDAYVTNNQRFQSARSDWAAMLAARPAPPKEQS